jgi:hypothetical protein
MDEQLKQQLMPAVIVFCWTVLAYVLIVYLFFRTRDWYFSEFMVQALIGGGIGLLTGGITLGITMSRK